MWKDLDARERKTILEYCLDSVRSAQSGHERRVAKLRDDWHRFTLLATPKEPSREHVPNRRVSVVQSAVLAKASKTWAALFEGRDFRISAIPVSDFETTVEHAQKVSRCLMWTMNSMPRIRQEAAIHTVRNILHGYAYVLLDLHRETYTHRTLQLDENNQIVGREDTQQQTYWGPRLTSIPAHNIIHPSEPDAKTLEDYSWLCSRVKNVTVQDLLDGEARGRFFEIRNRIKDITGVSDASEASDGFAKIDALADIEDGLSPVDADGGEARRSLAGVHEVWEVYFRWRLPVQTSGRRRRPDAINPRTGDVYDDNEPIGEADGNGRLFDLRRRGPVVELIAYILPRLQLLIGVTDARDHYPNQAERRPFLRTRMVETGRSVGMGLGDILAGIEDQTSDLWNLFTHSVAMQAGPLVLYDPVSGFNPSKFRYKPFASIPVRNPRAIQQISFAGNQNGMLAAMDRLQMEKSRSTGLGDFDAGVPGVDPGMPETMGGQGMLLNRADMRAALDLGMEKDNWSEILRRQYSLVCSPYMPREVRYRVMGDMPQLDVPAMGVLSESERQGLFSFRLTFADSQTEAQIKQATLQQIFQVASASPVIAAQPQIQAAIIREMVEGAGYPQLARMILPPAIDMPKTTTEELQAIYDGKIPQPNPMDDDIAHLNGSGDMQGHQAQLAEMRMVPPNRRNPQHEQAMLAHIVAHVQQVRQKQLMADAVRQDPGQVAPMQ